MSAFLRAIENIDDIYVTPRLQGVFVESMKKFHDYFEKNDLMNVIDLNIFFDKYLFRSTYPHFNKLKIKYKKIPKNKKKPYPYYGYFNTDINELVVVERPGDKTKDQDTIKEEQIATFIHEFIHFITLYGRINYKQDNKQIETNLLKYTKVKKGYISHENLYRNVGIFEPMTEILANKIQGKGGGSYKSAIDFMKALNEIFNIQSDKEFLRRNYKPYIDAISLQNFNKYYVASTMLIQENEMDYYTKYLDVVDYTAEVFDTILAQYYSLINDKITPKEFLNIQSKYHNNLPSFAEDNIKNLISSWVQYGNLLHIEHLLEKNNIKITAENTRPLQKVFVKGLGLKNAQMYADMHNKDFAVRVKIQNRTLAFMAKDGKLSVASPDNYKYVSDSIKFDLNKDTDFKDTEFKFKYYSIPAVRDSYFEFKKQKNRNFLTIKLVRNQVNQKGRELKNDPKREESEEIKIAFKGNRLYVQSSKKTNTFSKENIHGFLNNFDKLIEKEIVKLQKQQAIQEAVTERALLVVPQPRKKRIKLSRRSLTQTIQEKEQETN